MSKINYKLTNTVLGKGSSSTVVKAIDMDTGDSVACKIVFKDRLCAADLKSMRNEAQMMTRLNSEHIVRALAIAEDDAHIYLFQQLVRGADLCEVMDRRAREKRERHESAAAFSERRARRYFKQMLDAVEHCHAQGIVSRDIKLENFMLDERTDTIKLIDFGLADYLYTDGNSAKETADAGERLFDKFCGSPAYAAPELCSRTRYEGRPIDIWSLGVTLSCMLNGWFPFFADDSPQLFEKIINDEPRFDAKLAISSEAKALLRSMLQKNPSSRPTIAEIRRCAWLNKPQQAKKSTSRVWINRTIGSMFAIDN
jgi:serine/threonine protein kinase